MTSQRVVPVKSLRPGRKQSFNNLLYNIKCNNKCLGLILDMWDHLYLGQNIHNNNNKVDNVIFITPVE